MHHGGLSRRAFLGVVVAGAVAACTNNGSSSSTGTTTARGTTEVPPAPAGLTTEPFTLGVASGDPLADSVILWTRLAPEPLAGGAMPDEAVEVLWEVANDDAFADIVMSGLATAQPALAHSVHVDVSGLDADTWYWYRFRVGDHASPVGRTRTTPAAGELPASGLARVGFASCQNWQSGLYTAYPHVVAEELDLMLFLGDYIYEGGTNANAIRQHNSDEIRTLDEYRNRYALYRGDPDLQAAHAACPWVATWDDHEVDNNYANDISENEDPTDEFLARRASGYQAFYEHHPVRIDPPDGPDVEIYRAVSWGSLATIYVLDGRQYRSDQPCTEPGGLGYGASCGDELSESLTMLGAAQKDWLLGGLAESTAVWDVLANQTVMTRLPIAGAVFNFDQWDGYDAERREILEAAASRDDGNLVVVTGDIHAFGVGDLQAAEDGPAIGTEFVGGSISSTFPADFADIVQETITGLPQIKFADATSNGYGVLELTSDECRCRLRAVGTTQEPEADISTLSAWTVAAGTPGATPA
jgi:alkaline phosphatase D